MLVSLWKRGDAPNLLCGEISIHSHAEKQAFLKAVLPKTQFANNSTSIFPFASPHITYF